MLLGALVIVVMGVIVINYFRGQDAGDTVPGEATEQPRVVRGEGSVDYTVSEGESLWDIAEVQYGSGYNWVDIAEENSLSNPNMLEAGTTLTIPDVEPRTSTVSGEEVAMEAPAEEEGAIAGATYTVERGDTLWNIAVRAYGDGYRWVEIAEANSLANPNVIHAGNTLSLPR